MGADSGSQDCVSYNTLYVCNYTGQNLKVALVKTKRDSDGSSVLSDGKYKVEKIGSTITVRPAKSIDDAVIISGWGGEGGYDGYTARTEDGKYFITGALSSASPGPNSFVYNQGPTCYNAWVHLGYKDGSTSYLKFADGSDVPDDYMGSSFFMTPDGEYHRFVTSHIVMMFVILIFLAVIVIAGGVFYYKKYHSGL